MKIAVSATVDNMDAMVDPRFGRCAYFIIVEIGEGSIKSHEVIKNAGVEATHGAGIKAAQVVANKDVNAVISGNIGPNAFDVLSQSGIKIFAGVFGISVKESVQKYLRGELEETNAPAGPGFGRKGPDK